jgi:hypothetical protein
VHKSIVNIRNTITAGINIQMLIFSRYAVAAISHHKLNAQLSHINILAGLILKNMNATKVDIQIHSTVVAKYLWDMNRATANVINTKIFNHHASQSSQSVIFTAFTINIVEINVRIGNHRHK